MLIDREEENLTNNQFLIGFQLIFLVIIYQITVSFIATDWAFTVIAGYF